MRVRVSGMVVVLGLLVAATAQAAEVRVISAGAVKSIVSELAQAYEKESGNKVVIEFGPMGFDPALLYRAEVEAMLSEPW